MASINALRETAPTEFEGNATSASTQIWERNIRGAAVTLSVSDSLKKIGDAIAQGTSDLKGEKPITPDGKRNKTLILSLLGIASSAIATALFVIEGGS